MTDSRILSFINREKNNTIIINDVVTHKQYITSLKNIIFSKLVELDIVKHGSFTLKNGTTTDIYMDLRGLINTPQIFTYLAKLMDLMYPELFTKCNKIIPIPMGGLPFGHYLAFQRGIPFLMVRDKAKDHGTKKLIEGCITKNDIYMLVEDVITSGISIKETLANILESQSNTKLDIDNITSIICICNRGSLESINGIPIHALFNIEEVQQYMLTYKLPGTMCNYFKHTTPFTNILYARALQKGSNIILSCDFMSNQDILELINIAGEYIVAVKLHLDILDTASFCSFTEKLKELKRKYNLLVIEDAKYADIEAIMIEKVNHSLLDIKSIADAITIHAISGTSILEGAKLCIPGIVITEMSSADNMLSETYSKDVVLRIRKTLDNTDRDRHMVGGLVCQSVVPRMLEPFELLTMSPGINLEARNDDNNQRYTIPDTRNNKMGLFWIVGRGITQFYKNNQSSRGGICDLLEDVLKRYKSIGWNYFLNY